MASEPPDRGVLEARCGGHEEGKDGERGRDRTNTSGHDGETIEGVRTRALDRGEEPANRGACVTWLVVIQP